MSGGTRMTLKRYGEVVLDWLPIEIVVDQDFIDEHGLIIPIEHPFEPGKGQLDVYLNGQYLISGGGYEELYQAIRLDLGVNIDTGEPNQLMVGDEIFIKVHHNKYCSKGSSSTVSVEEFNKLRQEIYDAREYEGSTYKSLDERLDMIQKAIEMVESGMANVDIQYEHNNKGQITKQIITGDYNLTREFEFNSINQISKEIITQNEITVTKEHTWDLTNGRLLQTRVRVS